jgi:protease-4
MRRTFLLFALLLVLALVVTLTAVWLGPQLATSPSSMLASEQVLVWRLAGGLPEHLPEGTFLLPGEDPPLTLTSVYARLRHARTDPQVRGLALSIADAGFGLAAAEEIRRQLVALREADKFVICYLETAGEGSNGTLEYYLASACDDITLAPAGDVNLLGLHFDATFLRGTLDKLGIEPEFQQVGEFKSAGETFTRSEHSPAAETALEALLDSVWSTLTADLAADRGKSVAEIVTLVDGAPWSAEEALAQGLVDALGYPDEFRTAVEERAGTADLLALERYPRRLGPAPGSGPTIAVLVATGTIVRGESGSDPWSGEAYIGSDGLGSALRDLAEDDSVEAVVLRIDSPGGSALASDLLLREVTLLAEEKPVVVSMAGVAASGGYYLAARASKILAEATTITGSIGVVSGKLATRRFQEDLLGITHDALQRGQNADLYQSLDRYRPEQAARVESLMNRVYGTFVRHVAEGRGMTQDAVEAVAGGRVWTGADAQARGLVDELGGFDRAIELACEEAAIADCSGVALRFLPTPKSFFELLTSSAEPSHLLASWIGRSLRQAPRQSAQAYRLELADAWRELAHPF